MDSKKFSFFCRDGSTNSGDTMPKMLIQMKIKVFTASAVSSALQ